MHNTHVPQRTCIHPYTRTHTYTYTHTHLHSTVSVSKRWASVWSTMSEWESRGPNLYCWLTAIDWEKSYHPPPTVAWGGLISPRDIDITALHCTERGGSCCHKDLLHPKELNCCVLFIAHINSRRTDHCAYLSLQSTALQLKDKDLLWTVHTTCTLHLNWLALSEPRFNS